MLLRLTNPFPNPVIVNKPEHLTRRWAQSIITHQAYPGIANTELKHKEIQRLELVSVDVGTTTRVRLAVDHNVPDLPKRWFVKLPSLSLRAKAITALPRLLPTEVRFYNEIAPLVPVNKPSVLSANSRFGKGSTFVLTDVSEFGAQPGRAGDALSVEQARLVVEYLAHFHAHFLDKATHDAAFTWLAGPVRKLEDALGTALALPLMQRGLHLASDVIPPSLHKPALAYARQRKAIMQFLSHGTPTLVHHDCHPGNLFWQNGQPGFLDWQMVRIGEGIGDVSYFLATALAPDVRRQHEMALLKHYHAVMATKSKVETDFNQLLTRYRAHLAYPFEAMVVTLAVSGLMQLDSNLEMIRRAAIAVADHDAFGLIQNSA